MFRGYADAYDADVATLPLMISAACRFTPRRLPEDTDYAMPRDLLPRA